MSLKWWPFFLKTRVPWIALLPYIYRYETVAECLATWDTIRNMARIGLANHYTPVSYFQSTRKGHPRRASYRVSIVRPASGPCSGLIIALLYLMLCKNWPHCNNTRLYNMDRLIHNTSLIELDYNGAPSWHMAVVSENEAVACANIVCNQTTYTIKVNNRTYIRTALNIDGLLQDCNISIVLAVKILQSCTNPSTYPSNGKLLCT